MPSPSTKLALCVGVGLILLGVLAYVVPAARYDLRGCATLGLIPFMLAAFVLCVTGAMVLLGTLLRRLL
jgi:hypothetical protein